MYFEKNRKPDPYVLFEAESSFVDISNGAINYRNNLADAYQNLLANIDSCNYVDAHVTVYTPESFLNIINDLMLLNLIPFEISDFEVSGIEFIVHLKNLGYPECALLKNHYLERRNALKEICYKS